MFRDLDTQELVELGRKLISANHAIAREYGRGSDLNREVLDVLDNDYDSVALPYNIEF